MKSDLGVTPTNDGQVIRIALPQLTEERRKQMVKIVHQQTEDAKVSIRNVARRCDHQYQRDDERKNDLGK